MQATLARPSVAQVVDWGHQFDAFADVVHQTTRTVPKNSRLYQTDASGLFDLYLRFFAADPVHRQYLNCSCCRHFLERFGTLVWVDVGGNVAPYAFTLGASSATSRIDARYAGFYQAAAERVSMAKIVRPFYSRSSELGQREAGGHTHLYGHNPSVYTDRVYTPGQKAAADKEQFVSLARALREFPADLFDRASALLATANLAQTKFQAHAAALASLAHAVAMTSGQTKRDALIWRAMEDGGPGFAHVRSAAIGTLLEDLQKGTPDQDAMRKFSSIVDPMAYMRAQSAPKAGNIKRAEDLIAKLGLAPSLGRVVAEFEDVVCTWIPTSVPGTSDSPVSTKASAASGVFSYLQDVSKNAADIAGRTLTWDQFARKVLPTATCIQVIEDGDNTFGAVTSAADTDAPPIFAWDNGGADRNFYSWYRWNAIAAADFGVKGTSAVRGISALPCAWYSTGNTAHEGVILYLQGAADSRLDVAGLGLFPELLKADLREVRSTIHHHSMRNQLAPAKDGAFGLVLRRGFCRATLRVTSKGSAAATTYTIKNWD